MCKLRLKVQLREALNSPFLLSRIACSVCLFVCYFFVLFCFVFPTCIAKSSIVFCSFITTACKSSLSSTASISVHFSNFIILDWAAAFSSCN